MKIDGYSQVDVSVGVPVSVNDAHVHEMQRRSDKLMRHFIGDLMADRIATDRNELRRLRERVAGLLERNTSLVHTKRDLEAEAGRREVARAVDHAKLESAMASVERWKRVVDDFKAAHVEGQQAIEKLNAQLRTTKARLKATESELAESRATTERLCVELNRLVPGRGGQVLLGVPTRDIPIREIPICSRRDAN